MTLREAAGPSVWLTGSLVMITAAAWWWRSTVFRMTQAPPAAAPWKHVQEQYPLPPEPAGDAPSSPEVFNTILSANPFSPERRNAPVPDVPSPGSPSAPAAALSPQFVYKGLIKLGDRQRAIVEDAAAHKTYFLEVGQEVAGFKVLDIAENRVVLSDLQTKKEVVVSVASKASP